MSNQAAARDAENRKLIRRIMLGLLASVLFAVGMVPLYNVLCEATGFNGKTSGQASLAAKPLNVDQSRWVKVEFTSNVMPGLPWQFAPLTASVNVRPGQMQMVKYIAKNITSVASEGQAIPSITPGQAAQYFKKIECFCFQRQQLKPGESREMPLTFYVSPDIPPEITTITLSYAFFSAVKQNQQLSLAGAPALGQ